jgi:hypothetical protein
LKFAEILNLSPTSFFRDFDKRNVWQKQERVLECTRQKKRVQLIFVVESEFHVCISE